MPVARSLQVAQRTGILARWPRAPRDPAELAEHLGLQATGTELRPRRDRLARARRAAPGRALRDERPRPPLARPALRPLRRRLPRRHRRVLGVVGRAGGPGPRRPHVELHDKAPDDPYWRSYIRGQYQIARLSSRRGGEGDPAGQRRPLAARRRRRPRRVLDGALPPAPGTAGDDRRPAGQRPDRARDRRRRRAWTTASTTSTATCSRPTTAATTTAPSASTSSTTSPPTRRAQLFTRIRAVLRPGAPLCVLELYDRPEGQKPDSGSILGLFFHLTSGADTYTVEQVSALARRVAASAPPRRRPSAPCRAWRCSAPRLSEQQVGSRTIRCNRLRARTPRHFVPESASRSSTKLCASSVSAVTFRGRKYRPRSRACSQNAHISPRPDRRASPSRRSLAADGRRRHRIGCRCGQLASCTGRCRFHDDPTSPSRSSKPPIRAKLRRERRELYANLARRRLPGDPRGDRLLRVRRRPDRRLLRRQLPRQVPVHSAPGNRSAAPATQPRLPSPSRTTAPRCSTRRRAPAPGPSAADPWRERPDAPLRSGR